MNRVIELIVSPQGETRVETKGFVGNECQQASRFLESALGQRTDQELTQEFFQFESNRHNQQQRS